ncbi:zinc finger protein 423 homolog [Anopheles bellator]|uniref:zinc finger protein 423 homolog n=1 Tax=Anopheles bellator TaxID=139047 RepID=UPI0026480D2C|nr:zinc finger protein 423 homolog [Anopheles bellator]
MAMRMLYRGPSTRLETLIEKIQQSTHGTRNDLYSPQTSSSFSPSMSDGMATPNSITHDGGAEPGPDAAGCGEKSSFRAAGSNQPQIGHHHHPRHHHHHHLHYHHRRSGGGGGGGGHPKEGKTSRSLHHNNNNSSSQNNNNHTNSNSKNVDGTYHCQFCDKTFPRLGYLKKHEQSHTEHMPFKCEYCARLFKHKRSRDRHTKLHTGDRRYRCLHCEAAFSRSDHLKIHMKTHDNQKPFQCTICNRGYNTAAALTSHMQNHKKQLALTGSPNLTYSPRSTTSSLSSGGSKRAAKFSPYANSNHSADPLLLLGGRTASKLVLAKGSIQSNANRTPTPGNGGPGGGGGASKGGGAGSEPDPCACPYCTRKDFSSLEQLGLHVQSMHGGPLGGVLGATDGYFAPQLTRAPSVAGGRRAVTPDGGHSTTYPPIACEFCTMKFPTVPLMFAHLKATHLDRLAGGTPAGPHHHRLSPNGTHGARSPMRPSRLSGYPSLEHLQFNTKNLLSSTFSSLYSGLGAHGAGTTAPATTTIKSESRSTGTVRREHTDAEDESGTEPDRKRSRREARNKDEGLSDDAPEDDDPLDDDDEEDGIEDDDEDRAASAIGEAYSEVAQEPESSSHGGPENGTLIKQERKDTAGSASSSSARSSPYEAHLSHGSGSPLAQSAAVREGLPAEQLTPTDLSQPKMKRLKLEAPDEQQLLAEGDPAGGAVRKGGTERPPPSQQRRPRAGTARRESETRGEPQSLQHHRMAPQSSGGPCRDLAPASSLPPPGAYLCNQCNAALPDFESFRAHLKAHLEQNSANCLAAMAGASGSASSASATTAGALSLSTFLCQQCGATMSCQAEYEQHTIGHFLVTAVEYRCQAGSGGGGGPTCQSALGKGAFAKVEELHKHLYEGHMQLLYKCTACGETFDSKVQVQVHFAVSHSLEVKLYRCSGCAETFRTERDFRQHIRSRHLTGGAVQCMFCRVVCSSELEMHFHLASHARKYKCPACPESFHVEFLLDRHLQTHHSQKELASPNRRGGESNSNAQQSTANNGIPVSTTATATTTPSTGLDYLQLHGQMAAMAAAAAAASGGWPTLYQTANKFYGNPLHVDTLSQMKHPQQLLHGFYDTMLGKAAQHQHQQHHPRSAFLSETATVTATNVPTTSTSAASNKSNPFLGLSPNAAANPLLGLGYGSTGPSQMAASASALNGLYSPETSAAPNSTNGTANSTSGSSKLYSPISMLHSRYTAENGPSGPPARTESPSGQLGLPGLEGKLNAPPACTVVAGSGTSKGLTGSASSSSTGGGPPLTSGGSYSCGICERTDFSTESEVQTHRKIVHNLKTGVSLRCAYCNGDFRSRNELENHMKIAHNTGGGKHKCLICDEIFPSPAVLAEHKLSHCKVGASGRCSHCALPLPDAHTFKQHLPVHQASIGAGSSTPAAAGPAVSTASSNTLVASTGGTGGSGASSAPPNGVQTASGTTSGTSGGSGSEQDRFPQQCICCRQTLNSEFEISLHAKFHTKSPDTNERTCALCLEPLPSQPEASTKICDPCLKRHNFPTKLLSMNFLKPPATATSTSVPATAASAPMSATPGGTPVATTTLAPSHHGAGEPYGGHHLMASSPESAPIMLASSPPSVQCNLCRKALPSAHKLQEHLIDHTFAGCEERGYVCYLCSAVFTSSAGLQAHLPVAHSNATAKPYDCERCGVAYFFRAELEHHLAEHELGRPVLEEWPAALAVGGSHIKQERADEEELIEESILEPRRIAGEGSLDEQPEDDGDVEEEEEEYIEVEHTALEEAHKESTTRTPNAMAIGYGKDRSAIPASPSLVTVTATE